MLKKEAKEVSKQSFYFIIGVVFVTFLVLIGSLLLNYSISCATLFFAVFQVGLLIFGMFAGISLFSSDTRDGGMEYLLTLPYSRLRLLMFKIIPRITVLILLFLLYLLLISISGGFANFYLVPPSVLFFFYIALFVMGVSFSLFRGSFTLSALITVVVFIAFMGIIHLVEPIARSLKTGIFYGGYSMLGAGTPGFMVLATVGLMIAFAAAFVYAFKTFDLTPSRKFIKRYLIVFVPITVIVMAVSLVWAYSDVYSPKDRYYLTANDKMIEYNYYSARIYDGKDSTVTEIEPGEMFLGGLLAKDNYIYAVSYADYKKGILQLNTENNRSDILYRPKGNNIMHYWLYIYKDTIAFFERFGEKLYRKLVLLQKDTGAFKKIKVPTMAKVAQISPTVFGAGEIAGKPFWLLYTGYYARWHVLRVWEDGTVEDLATTGMRPAYVNGMLITRDNNTVIFNKLNAMGLELIKKLPVEKDFVFFRGIGRNLDHMPAKEIYGGVRYPKEAYHWKKIMRLDLQTLEINEIKSLENSSGFFNYCHPDTWYYTDLDPDSRYSKFIVKKLYSIKEGNLDLLKEFEPLEVIRKNNYYRILDTGLVLKRDGSVYVYTLPGLKELNFEKLK